MPYANNLPVHCKLTQIKSALGWYMSTILVLNENHENNASSQETCATIHGNWCVHGKEVKMLILGERQGMNNRRYMNRWL